MKKFKYFVYALFALIGITGLSACSDDDASEYTGPAISGDYTVCADAYAYWTETVVGDDGKTKTVSHNEPISQIEKGEVWNFNGGTLTITKPGGNVLTGKYTFSGRTCQITFPDGTVTNGFSASYEGITYFFPKNSTGDVDQTKDPEYEQLWYGIGEVIYITKGDKEYRVTIPARRTLEKRPFSGKMRPRYEVGE